MEVLFIYLPCCALSDAANRAEDMDDIISSIRHCRHHGGMVMIANLIAVLTFFEKKTMENNAQQMQTYFGSHPGATTPKDDRIWTRDEICGAWISLRRNGSSNFDTSKNSNGFRKEISHFRYNRLRVTAQERRGRM